MSHTPGPWAVHSSFWNHVVPADHAARPVGGAADDAYDLAHYAQEVCLIYPEDRHREQGELKANANLIAAAPDLLEMTKRVAAFFPTDSKFNLDARKVIAKAEGL